MILSSAARHLLLYGLAFGAAFLLPNGAASGSVLTCPADGESTVIVVAGGGDAVSLRVKPTE